MTQTTESIRTRFEDSIHSPEQISLVLHRTTKLLEHHGWTRGGYDSCPNGKLDVCRALRLALEMNTHKDGLWHVCREALMNQVGEAYCLAKWNDRQTLQHDVIEQVTAAADRALRLT